MPPKGKNLSGMVFGLLTAKEVYSKNGKRYWKCVCACTPNVLHDVPQQSLKKGYMTSCGCRAEKPKGNPGKKYIGKRFGKLAVIDVEIVYMDWKYNSKQKIWHCNCDCGGFVKVRTDLLTMGRKTSCGCEQETDSSTPLKEGERYHDLTGIRFGLLVVKHESEERSASGGMIWNCICDCGNEISVRALSLRHRNTKSCGCLSSLKEEEHYIGQRFDRLVVIAKGNKTEFGHQKWICRCDCGNEKEIIGFNLGDSKGEYRTRSCGCYSIEVRESMAEDLKDLIFGRLKCISKAKSRKSYAGNNRTYWLCHCECGNFKGIDVVHLKNGDILSCGCLRNEMKGKFAPGYVDGSTNLVYYFRNRITEWKESSKRACNYRCIISGEYFDKIHHLYSFSQIVRETFRECDLPILDKIADYSQEDLVKLFVTFHEIHDSYGLGVCLTEDLHNEFHNIYGNRNFAPSDFYQFYYGKTGKRFEQIAFTKE
jgi:hypothetical protein